MSSIFLLLYSCCATIRQKPANYIFVLVVLFDMIDFEQLRLSVSEIMSVSVRSCINILSYSVLFIWKKFCRAKAFSRILINLSKNTGLKQISQLMQKLQTTSIIWEQFFQKGYNWSESKKKKMNHQILHNENSLNNKFHVN